LAILRSRSCKEAIEERRKMSENDDIQYSEKYSDDKYEYR
jgi:hypothetical protein